MANGPIDFASDEPRDDKGPTEFGGVAGLVDVGGVHELTGSEKRGVLVRAVAVAEVDVVTGLVEVDEAADAVDPVTGVAVDPLWNEDGSTGAAPVELPLRTGDAGAAEL